MDGKVKTGLSQSTSLVKRPASYISLSSIGSFMDSKFLQSEVEEVVQEEPATIVMPLDASPSSEMCLLFYLKYLHKPGNLVHVIYVMEDYFKNYKKRYEQAKPDDEPTNTTSCCGRKTFLNKILYEVGPSPGVLAELDRTDRLKSHFMKSRVKSLFRVNGVVYRYHRLLGNDTSATIIKFTLEHNGDMIVMGSRGLGAIKRRVLGGISSKVVHASPVPVLVVNSKGENKTRFASQEGFPV